MTGKAVVPNSSKLESFTGEVCTSGIHTQMYKKVVTTCLAKKKGTAFVHTDKGIVIIARVNKKVVAVVYMDKEIVTIAQVDKEIVAAAQVDKEPDIIVQVDKQK